MTPEEIAKWAARLHNKLRAETTNGRPNGMEVFSDSQAFELTKAALEIKLSVSPMQFDD